MDYNEFEKSIYDFHKKGIILKFKNASREDRPFNKALDDITSELSEIRNNSIIRKNENLLKNCTHEINHRLDYYKSDIALNSIISNEIKDSFNKISDRIVGLNNEKLNISYDDFIKELITYDCLGRIEQIVKNNKDLYKIFYDNNDYKEFTIEKFEGHVVNSKLYRKVFAKFYPDKFVPIAIETINEFGQVTYKIKLTEDELDNDKIKIKKSEKQISKFLVKYNNIANLLTDDEKLLLIHICLTKKYKIDESEQLKLILLSSGINDFRIFEELPNKNLVYNKVNKGLKYNYSSATKIELVNSIKSKIELCKLVKTEEILDSLLININ